MPLVPNYNPTDWVDHVTPVDEAHMDKLDVAVDQHADAINALDTRLVAEEAMPDVPAVVNGKWAKGASGAVAWADITITDVQNLNASLNAKQDTRPGTGRPMRTRKCWASVRSTTPSIAAASM